MTINYIENYGTTLENTDNEINKLKLTIDGETDKETDYQYKDIKLLKSDNGKLKNKMKSLKNKNNKLNKEVNDLTKFKKSILSSKSWKLTKPFRAFLNFFRKK